MKIDLPDKADQALLEALARAGEDEVLCVILKLDTEKEPPAPILNPVDFLPNYHEYKQTLRRQARERIYRAVAGTLEELRSFGLDPQGWELGQVVVHGNRAAIRKALRCEGVEFGVLNWDLGLYEALVNDEEEMKRYTAEAPTGETAK